jgi:hypothetical protein
MCFTVLFNRGTKGRILRGPKKDSFIQIDFQMSLLNVSDSNFAPYADCKSMISNNMLFINWIYCNWFLLHLLSMTIDNYFPVDVIKPLTLASICGGSNNLLLCSILNLYLYNIVNRCCVNIGSVKITVLLQR